jgi:hypothetical protein
MTTPADDFATERAFEALLAGRAVPEEAAGLAAFTGAVRASATQPGRPNAALAELLATGLLTDQSSPSVRTAVAAGDLPSRSPRVRRRRFAMIFPAILAKFLAAGAVAQAATGAGIVVVAVTGAGAAGVLGDDVQQTITSAVGAGDAESATDGSTATGDDLTTPDAGAVQSPAVATTVPVTPEFDGQAWLDKGPEGYASFGAWVTDSAHNPELREWLRTQGSTFGSMVSDWAHKKGLDDSDLAEEGVDLDELTEDPATTAPTTTESETETESSDDQAGSSHGNSGSTGSGHGNSGGNGKSGHH